ncbi:MAG: HupE/UreJ family protein, partial [bacterium]|nr:HupE/UreJ family protein [bacterium]
MRVRTGMCGVLVALLALAASSVPAHQVHTSYSTLALSGGAAALVLAIDEGDLYLLFPHLDTNGDGALWAEEVLAGAASAQQWLGERVSVRADGEDLALQEQHPRIESDADGNLFMRASYQLTLPADPALLQVDYTALLQPPLLAVHRNLLKLTIPGRVEALVVLSAEQPLHEVRLREEAASIWSQLGGFVWLGVEHIWIGYDHIMFLLALIIIGSRLGPLIKIVTAFTVAHSITLILATFELVALPSRLVEAGIAVSIIYVAAENFWLRDARHRWMLTFGFGFIHGFGFASVLRDLGLPREGLIASLLGFNVGVEVGQIVIVAAVFPAILWISRQSFHERAVQVLSGAILLFGLGWLVERVFDLSFMPI